MGVLYSGAIERQATAYENSTRLLSVQCIFYKRKNIEEGTTSAGDMHAIFYDLLTQNVTRRTNKQNQKWANSPKRNKSDYVCSCCEEIEQSLSPHITVLNKPGAVVGDNISNVRHLVSIEKKVRKTDDC